MAKTRSESADGNASARSGAAKSGAVRSGGAKSGAFKSFEERLERLEVLGETIRKTGIPLDEAIKAFEEGIKLARTLELDLEKIENRIEILTNNAEALADESPELELFTPDAT
jgi:exodeoxyribonuclease VII small subunit